MKRPVRDLIRSLVRLVEDDVTELRDAVVEIDHRESEHYRERAGNAVQLERRVGHLEEIDLHRRIADAEASIANIEAIISQRAEYADGGRSV